MPLPFSPGSPACPVRPNNHEIIAKYSNRKTTKFIRSYYTLLSIIVKHRSKDIVSLYIIIDNKNWPGVPGAPGIPASPFDPGSPGCPGSLI